MKKDVDKYFEGYETRVFIKPNGKTGKEFVYTGDYYHIDADLKARNRIKLFSFLFFSAYLAVYLIAGFSHSAGNLAGPTGIVSLVILIPMVYWLLGLIEHVTTKEYMEARKFHYGLKRISKCLSGIFFFTLAQIAAEIIVLILRRDIVFDITIEILFFCMIACEALLTYVNRHYLKKIEIDIVPHDSVPHNSLGEPTA